MYVIAAVVLAAAGPGAPVFAVQDTKAAVMDAVAVFRRQQGLGAFEAMRDGGSPTLKKESEAAFVERMRAHSAHLGRFVSSVADVAMGQESSEGVTYTLRYQAKYRNGRAIERFDFRLLNGTYVLEAFTVIEAQLTG